MAKQAKDIKKIVEKKFPDFVSATNGASVSTLEQKLLMYAKEQQNVNDAKAADKRLEAAQESVSELKGPYSDAANAIKLKMKYVITLIKEQGGNS